MELNYYIILSLYNIMNEPINQKLYDEVKKEADNKYKKPSAYKSSWIVKEYKKRGGTYSGEKTKDGLTRWHKEQWESISKPNEYPVYRPTKKISKDTPLTTSEIDPKQAKEQIKLKQKIKGDKNLPKFKNKNNKISSHSIMAKQKKQKQIAGALKASQIKDAVDLTYVKRTDEAPQDYVIDKELSDGRVKVFKDVNSDQVIVAHRGSSGIRDWIDNIRYGLTGQMNTTGTFKKHEERHQKALDKYGAENVIAIGHSRAGKYVENLNDKQPVKEVITYNKASGPFDLFRKNAENQTDVRSGIDAVSALAPLQKHENKIITIPTKTADPLKAHSTMPLNQLGDKLIGKGNEVTGGAGLKKKNYKPEFLPPLITERERMLSKMKKDELIKFANDENVNVNARMTKKQIMDILMATSGVEYGTRYKYKTDYPKCETIIKKVYDCYGDNSKLQEEREKLEELKNNLDKVNERIRRLQRQTFSSDPKMQRDDKRDMNDALKLKKTNERLVKSQTNKLLELEYECQSKIYGLIDCEKYRVGKQAGENIERPEDWEERNKRFLPERVEIDEDDEDEDIQYEFEETKDDSPSPPKRGVKFDDEVREIEFESEPAELGSRKKYNYCIKKRHKLNSKTKLPELKKELLKLKPDYDMKGKSKRDIIAEILKIKKCDKLIDVRSFNEEEIEIELDDDDIEFDDDDEEESSEDKEDDKMFPLPKTRVDESVARDFVYNYEPSKKESHSPEFHEKYSEYANLLKKPFRRELNAIYNKLKEKILGRNWYILPINQARQNFRRFIYNNRELYDKGIREGSDEMKLIERYKELEDKISEIPLYFRRRVPDIRRGGSALQIGKGVQDFLPSLIDDVEQILKKMKDIQSEEEKKPDDPEEEEEFEFEVIYEIAYPRPIVNPETTKQTVDNIKEKIEQLKEVGEEKGAVYYSGNNLVGSLALLIMLEKYGSKCIITKTPKNRISNKDLSIQGGIFGITINADREKTEVLNNQESFENLATQLKECVDRNVEIIAMKLTIKSGGPSGHANMLVYRPSLRLVERYEPHGIRYFGPNSKIVDDQVNQQLKELFEVRLTDTLGPIRYSNPSEVCPRTRGFQSLENQLERLESEGGGYCQMWSIFLLELVFLNPTLTTRQILESAFKITENNPVYLRDLIRGYTVEVEKSIDKIIKKISDGTISFSYKDFIESKKTKGTIYSIANLYGDQLLKWVTDTIFDIEDDFEVEYIKRPESESEKSGGSALRGFSKAIGKINPASIALKHKKSRDFMQQQGDLTRDYYLPELVSIGIPVARSAAMMGSTMLTGNPVLGQALFDASYKTMVTDKGYDPRDQSKAKKINKASQKVSNVASAKAF